MREQLELMQTKLSEKKSELSVLKNLNKTPSVKSRIVYLRRRILSNVNWVNNSII